MKIAVLGFAREGKSTLQFLKKSPRYKNAEIWILDKNPNVKLFDTIKRIGTNIQAGKDYLKNLNKFDIVFRTPGAPYNLPEIQKAVKKGVKFSSATKLFFDNFKGKIIAVTGTKGKGTTATLIYKILKACDKKVIIAGNMGKPMAEELLRPQKANFAVIEISSFQLQDLDVSPSIAVILDIFPDHMDAHKNMKEYLDAKANIARFQQKSDKIFYFSDNKYCRWIASKSRAKKISVQCRDIGCPDIKKILGTSDVQKLIKIPGEHNLKNAVMAATVAKSLGCPKEKIIKTIRGFRGNEHRLELTRIIRINQLNQHKSAFISFYNDSASTNPQTAAAAVKSFAGPKILICGGKDKGLNYSPLAQALKNSNTKLVILFGENKNKIYKAIRKVMSNEQLEIRTVNDLKAVVNLAYKKTKSLITPYSPLITVIFSPASASFDMFKNYAERGKIFKEIVKKLK